jgi:allophanate hydrolase subunit 2
MIGAVQVPSAGLPIILGPEGPTTGGYAQIGIISRTSWTVLAGKTPGSYLRFQWLDPKTAGQAWNDRQNLFSNPDAWKRL